MHVQRVVASPWQSNCYLIRSDAEVRQCLVIDPGITSFAPVVEALGEVEPVAVLGTHGHVDHVGDAHLFARRWAVPVYLHPADQHLLVRPGAGLGSHGDQMVRQILGTVELPGIDDVRGWDSTLTLAGVRVEPFEAPGHTPGSTLLRICAGDAAAVFTGDVLFAGTIGRTDLPGGSMSAMRESLRRIVEHFPPETALLPGHGEPTSLARELATNPYLQPDF